MTLAKELVQEWEDAFGKGAKSVFTRYRKLVRDAPEVPVDTGALRDGIEYTERSTRGGQIVAVLESTARSDEGADYGTILDTSKGQKIVPRSKKALANTRTGWGPYASATLTTKHVGWWEKANSLKRWDQAAKELSRFGL